MPLSRHTVIALTCLAVLSWGAADLIYEINMRNTDTPPLHTTAQAPTVDIEATARSLGFTTVPGKTASSFLSQLIPETLQNNLQGAVLLGKNDRRAEIAFISTSDAPILFTKLKTSLYLQFSPDVTNIEDVSQQDRAGMPIHFFGFSDPRLSEERVLFIQRGALLIELHIADEGRCRDAQRIEIPRRVYR